MNLLRAAAASAIFATEATAVLMQKHTLSMRPGPRAADKRCSTLDATETGSKPVPKSKESCKDWCENTPHSYMLDSQPMAGVAGTKCTDAAGSAMDFKEFDATTGTCTCKKWTSGSSCTEDLKVCGSAKMAQCADDVVKEADSAKQKGKCAAALNVPEDQLTLEPATKDAAGKCIITAEGDWAPGCTLPKKVDTPPPVSPVCDKPAEMTKEKCEKEFCKDHEFKEYNAAEKEKEGSCVCNKPKDAAKPESNKCTIPKGTEIAEPKGKDDGSSGS